jgi:putative DNA primase/helicase
VKFERVFRGTADEIKDLDKQLADEYPGILNWALAGLEAWQESDGLREPQTVKQAVKEYMTDENCVARWLKERTVQGKNGEVPIKEAFSAYKQWSEETEEFCKTDQWFGRRMAQLGYKSEPINGRRVYCGFTLAVVQQVLQKEAPVLACGFEQQ